MSMIKCSECGGAVSDRLGNCPHCGAHLVKRSERYSQFYEQPKQYQSEPQYIEIQHERPRTQKSSKSIALSVSAIIISVMGFLMSFIAIIVAASSPKEVYVDREVPVYKESKAKEEINPDPVQDEEIEEKSIKEEERQEPLEVEEEKEKEGQKEEKKETENTKDFYSVGETWENKYVLVSYDDCGEFTSDNQFLQPEAGNKYIYATFTFENVGKSDTTVGYWDFDCYADGYACDGAYLEGGGAFSQSLSVGRKITGTIYYEVPENANSIELEYSPNFWTSDKIVFVYE